MGRIGQIALSQQSDMIAIFFLQDWTALADASTLIGLELLFQGSKQTQTDSVWWEVVPMA